MTRVVAIPGHQNGFGRVVAEYVAERMRLSDDHAEFFGVRDHLAAAHVGDRDVRKRRVGAQQVREAVELLDQQRFVDRLFRHAQRHERDQVDRIDAGARVDAIEQFDAESARDMWTGCVGRREVFLRTTARCRS